MKRFGIALALGLGLGASGALAQEAEMAAGEVEYVSACAGCHGRDAKGDGPMADLLKISTPDLTTLSERSGGAFPIAGVIQTIDGRADVSAHGGAMPVWGDRYMVMAQREQDAMRPPRWPVEPEVVVRGRILSLVYYLESIQE